MLDRTLPRALDLRGLSLEGAIARLRAETGNSSIFVNYAALELEGVTKQTPISLSLPAGTRLDEALRLLCANAGAGRVKLGFVADERQISLSTMDDLSRNVDTVVMDARHIVAGRAEAFDAQEHGPRVKQIIELIRETVEPKQWVENGGQVGRIAELNGQIVVTATPEMLAAVAGFLTQLDESGQGK